MTGETFNVGDKVRLVKDVYSAAMQPGYPVAPGTVGTVVRVAEDCPWPLDVDFDTPDSWAYPCDPSELERVAE